MKYIKKYLLFIYSSKILFFCICSTVILTLNLTPLIANIRHSPEGRTFALIHNNTQDFFFYQSLMNKGANGDWLTTDPYTTEFHSPSIVFSYFLWLGKLSKLLGIPYAYTYHLVRIILSVAFLAVSYFFILYLSFPYPYLTFFFFVFASPFFHQIIDWGKVNTVPYMYWWTGIDAIRRSAYLPHHMFGGLMLILIIFCLLKIIYTTERKLIKQYLAFSILLTPITVFIHPPSLLIIILFLPSLIILFLLRKIIENTKKIGSLKIIPSLLQEIKPRIRNYSALTIFWFLGIIFLFIMVWTTNRGLIWSKPFEWEKQQQLPVANELFGAFGIIFPLSIIGIIKSLSSTKFKYYLIVAWLITPLLLIPFALSLQMSNIRLIQGVPFLPLSILAAIGVKTIEDFLVSIFKRRQAVSKKIPRNLIGSLFHCIIVIIFIIFTYPTLIWSVKDQIREYWPIFGNVYFDNRLYYAFSFINSSFPKDTITLSTFFTGNYLPAFSHTVSFIGHTGYTYNANQKQELVKRFFENKMTETEVKDLIMNNNITLIFQGPEEKPIYSNYLYPQLLKPVYDREEATIYIPIK
ncbi:hypothetical protein A2Y99_03145 [Candidatus Gottesmanbacteria bacterium RBG_13_37_7]|uniref:Glycosyltransferase RgtA/B/C/D-like domain-containing protein n=1 Tax=Candidatus Gottesmanbacteria bacterium RBG_13_37_7 TaxID=1798369 RepID=A0A1F5YGS1_9BACT|nr:MAG: hypothetical protein A2Y99_03145 [Candidatus Gottesmanbacteria bacterium RBG_13_37_7]